jgi:citrate lyase subunit beta/citryl-CoA lyase
MRSLLFVPATRADRFQKALDSGADAVVLDLEDAVEAGRKDEARALVGEFLDGLRETPAAVLVRINAAGSDWIDDDCEWLGGVQDRIDAVVLPKAESPESIEGVANALRSGRVIPLLETARGILAAPEILAARADIPAVLFGAEDLTAELGIPRTLSGEELLYARSRVVLAAATVGADPIDAVWVRISDTESLRTDAARAKALGFLGKMAIHPDQIPIINEVFSPTGEEIAAARRLIEADDRAREQGEGVFRLDDSMVDAPVIRRARRILSLAERATQS